MRKYITILSLLVGAFVLFTAESEYSSGSPGNRTGSPGDNGANCSQCHSSSVQNAEDWISFDENLVNGYVPGETYTITLNPVYASANKFGFEMGVEDANNTIQGDWTSLDNRTALISFSHTITHTTAGNVPTGSGSTQWTMEWTAPEESAGDLTFYAAINAANGNGTTTGDHIFLTQKTVSPATAIAEKTSPAVKIFPNPVSNQLHINNVNGEVRVFSVDGKLWMDRNVEQETSIDVRNLPAGMYILSTNGVNKKFVINH